MKKVVITGANGFIGRNLIVRLKQTQQADISTISREDSWESIQAKLKGADFVYHLAGVNRPADAAEFETVNHQFTRDILSELEKGGKPYKLIFSSSIQAVLENPYGASKMAAENELRNAHNGEVVVFRLPGIFGKWCRPNYNSVVATFCHNVANNLSLQIHNAEHQVTLAYIDDVVDVFLAHLDSYPKPGQFGFEEIKKSSTIKLGALASIINSFKDSRETLMLPNVGNRFIKHLYSTYLTYLPENAFSYSLIERKDERGSLFELLKSENAGQIFLSSTLPGITRGNHYHHTKTEKFIVIRGEGLIRFRHLESAHIIEYKVTGDNPTIVDIPPGYTHNITNIGTDTMITLFWANEIFNPEQPDTIFLPV